MKLPELIIVAKAQLSELQERSRLWWLGWAAAALTFTCAAGVLAWTTELVYRMARLQHDAVLLQAQLDETEKGVVRQWQEQQMTIAMNIAWGKYIKDRMDISSTNGPACPTVPPRTRPRPLVASPGVDFRDHVE